MALSTGARRPVAKGAAGAASGMAAGVGGEYRTLQTIVTARLRDAILGGRLGPGARLQQDDLAHELGVSRMPIREALRVLHSEGLVELEPHRGAVVIDLRPEDIHEVFEIRAALEARAVMVAATRLTDQTLAALHRACAEMDEPALDDEAWLEGNLRFHRLIYEACGWPRLCALIEAQRNVTQPYLRAGAVFTGRRATAQREHHALAAAAAARDGRRLAALTEEHLRTTAGGLIAYLSGRAGTAEGVPEAPENPAAAAG